MRETAESKTGPKSLPELPEDLWLKIFGMLEIAASLQTLCFVCKTWWRLSLEATGEDLCYSNLLRSSPSACLEAQANFLETRNSLEPFFRRRASTLQKIFFEVKELSSERLKELMGALSPCNRLKSLQLTMLKGERQKWGKYTVARDLNKLPSSLAKLELNDNIIIEEESGSLPVNLQTLQIAWPYTVKYIDKFFTQLASMNQLRSLCLTSFLPYCYLEGERGHIDWQRGERRTSALTRLTQLSALSLCLDIITVGVALDVRALPKLESLSFRALADYNNENAESLIHSHCPLKELRLEFGEEIDPEEIGPILGLPKLCKLQMLTHVCFDRCVDPEKYPFNNEAWITSSLRELTWQVYDVINIDFTKIVKATNLHSLRIRACGMTFRSASEPVPKDKDLMTLKNMQCIFLVSDLSFSFGEVATLQSWGLQVLNASCHSIFSRHYVAFHLHAKPGSELNLTLAQSLIGDLPLAYTEKDRS